MTAFFDAVGVQYRSSEPDAELDFFATGNTLLGAQTASKNKRILLVDNDVLFLRDLRQLQGRPQDTLYGAPSGHQRISTQQWQFIADATGLAPLNQSWIASKQTLAALANQAPAPAQIPQTYINGGVLLLPTAPEFPALWRRHILQIAAAFQRQPLASASVIQSNMAGLATAAGHWKKFAWLEDAFNYRHTHLLLGTCPYEDIAIIHMTGNPRGNADAIHTVSDYFTAFWSSRIITPLEELASAHHPDRYLQAKGAAEHIQATVVDLIHKYRLDIVLNAV